jgi:hypothetical protein
MAVLDTVFHGLNEGKRPDPAKLEQAIRRLAAVYEQLPDDMKNAMELRGWMAQLKSMADAPALPDQKEIWGLERMQPLPAAGVQEHKGAEASLKNMIKSETAEAAVHPLSFRHAEARRDAYQTDLHRLSSSSIPVAAKPRPNQINGYGIDKGGAGTELHFSRFGTDMIPEQQGSELSRKLVSILERAHFFGRPHAKKLTIRLYPEHLGTLRVELIQKGGEMAARILTSTAMAKKLLDSQLNFLHKTLLNQNIQIEKVEIVHHQPLDKHDPAGQRDGHHGRQEQKNNQEQQKNAEKNQDPFSLVLTDTLFEKEV